MSSVPNTGGHETSEEQGEDKGQEAEGEEEDTDDEDGTPQTIGEILGALPAGALPYDFDSVDLGMKTQWSAR